MPIIEVKNLSFAYGTNVVLDNVSFSIERGDYVGIVGPNGGGKTTLLKIIVGLLAVQKGQVKVFGEDIKVFKNKSDIGYVPQRVAQDQVSFPATVYEVVESGRVPKKSIFSSMNKNDNRAIEKAFTIAGISDLSSRLMSDLSGGQRQRVFVARALAGEPKMLVLDEPFVGIDVSAQKDFYAFLKELNQNHGLTIIFVSHDVDVITEEVKSILCLNKGILCLDSPAQLHEPNVIENLYGKKITHIHHNH